MVSSSLHGERSVPVMERIFMEVEKITASSLYRLVVAGVITKEEARAILKRSGLLE